MPPSTMPSTSSVISFPGRHFGSSDRKPRRIGTARPPRHNVPEGVHLPPPGRAQVDNAHPLATPTDGKPITKFVDLDDAFLEVTQGDQGGTRRPLAADGDPGTKIEHALRGVNQRRGGTPPRT